MHGENLKLIYSIVGYTNLICNSIHKYLISLSQEGNRTEL